MEYLKIFGLLASPFIIIYLVIKSKILESKLVNLVVGVLFSVYALGVWVELQFLNYSSLSIKDGYFELISAISIIQLPMALIFWFYFFHKFSPKKR